MVLFGRVFCNFCECYIGQLFETVAVNPRAIESMSLPPHFTVCHDCFMSSEVVSLPKQQIQLECL